MVCSMLIWSKKQREEHFFFLFPSLPIFLSYCQVFFNFCKQVFTLEISNLEYRMEWNQWSEQQLMYYTLLVNTSEIYEISKNVECETVSELSCEQILKNSQIADLQNKHGKRIVVLERSCERSWSVQRTVSIRSVTWVCGLLRSSGEKMEGKRYVADVFFFFSQTKRTKYSSHKYINIQLREIK